MAQRYIYLSDELNKKLGKEDNASGLIQSLLEEHFRKRNVKTMTERELKKFVETEKLKKEFDKRMEVINNG